MINVTNGTMKSGMIATPRREIGKKGKIGKKATSLVGELDKRTRDRPSKLESDAMRMAEDMQMMKKKMDMMMNSMKG